MTQKVASKATSSSGMPMTQDLTNLANNKVRLNKPQAPKPLMGSTRGVSPQFQPKTSELSLKTKNNSTKSSITPGGGPNKEAINESLS